MSTDSRDPAPVACVDQGPVSIVICSHLVDRWEWLYAAVRSIARQSRPAQATVVVIDGNRDLAKLAAGLRSDTCTVLVRETCGGLSEARNTGLAAVTTPFVAFLDDDAEADAHWLERLMEPLADPRVLGVGGRSIPLWEHGEPAWFPPELLWVVGCSYAGLPNEIAPVRNVFGGCAVYRRELFERYGGFRPDFGRHLGDAAGCEETEFCMRVASSDAHGRFVYQPQAIIQHHVPAKRATVRYVVRRSFADGRAKIALAAHLRGGGGAWRPLATEISYARLFVARSLLAGLHDAARGDALHGAQSAVLALSMFAAACGSAAGLASAAKSLSALQSGWRFRRAGRTEWRDSLAPTDTPGDGPNLTPRALEPLDLTAGVSVVICAYTEDRWDDTVAAVRSLREQTLEPAEVVLVIDHNRGLFERARSLEGTTTIENSRAPGASGSRNSGVAAASGSVVAFLDDDATARPDWLELLWGHYATSDVAGVGGSIEPVWPAEAPAWFPDEFLWIVGCTFRGMRTTPGAVRNLIGANMSVRRDLWEGVGGFREGFGNVKNSSESSWAGESRASTGEETEFCIRVSHAYPGLQWIFEPRARVWHRVPSHRSTLRYFASRCRLEGLGKAALVSEVGRESALVAEIDYTRRILPRGIARGLEEAITGRDADGLKRAGAISVGFSMAAAGFAERWVRTVRATL